MVNAMPEHGETPPHSLLPELSMVVTSTTPGPLAVLVVHDPVGDEPLTQIDVNDGEAIREPRAAPVGLRNVGSDLTYMSKPPIALELLMKTPIVNVEPKVSGPIVGALLLQFVAVVEVVIQTRPVPVNPAARTEGTVCEPTNSEVARIGSRRRMRRLFKTINQPSKASDHRHHSYLALA